MKKENDIESYNMILITYTLKTLLKTGKYEGQEVSVICKIDPDYLINGYFKWSKITFDDNVLDMLMLGKEYRFNKPGTNPIKAKQFFTDRLSKMTVAERIIYYNSKRKKRTVQEKLKMARHMNDERHIFNKQSLANMNRSNTKLDLKFRTIDGKSMK